MLCPSRIILALGSNLGNRMAYLENAILKLKQLSNAKLFQQSSIYETLPLNNAPQPKYLNCCISFETTLSPDELLIFCKNLEVKLGRQLRPRWHSREIDIDILTYGKIIMNQTHLKIPHPEITNRIFVLKPLADLEPLLILPNQTKTVVEFLNYLTPDCSLSLYDSPLNSYVSSTS